MKREKSRLNVALEKKERLKEEKGLRVCSAEAVPVPTGEGTCKCGMEKKGKLGKSSAPKKDQAVFL